MYAPMETLNLKPIEKAKIDCARKLFHNFSSADVVYDSVDQLSAPVRYYEQAIKSHKKCTPA